MSQHVRIEIDFTPANLRYADVDLYMSDGTFYEGRLELSDLTQELPDFLGTAAAPFAALSLKLNNLDGELDLLLMPGRSWANKKVTLTTGSGRTEADYTVQFEGLVRFPQGMTRTDKSITFIIDDIRRKDMHDIPAMFFEHGSPIPIIYGKFAGAFRLPVPKQDSATYKLAEHALNSFDGLFLGEEADCIDVEITHDSIDEATASFEYLKDWHKWHEIAADYDLTNRPEYSFVNSKLIACTKYGSDGKVYRYDGRAWTSDNRSGKYATWIGDGTPLGAAEDDYLWEFDSDGKVYYTTSGYPPDVEDDDFSPLFAVDAAMYRGNFFALLDDGSIMKRTRSVGWAQVKAADADCALGLEVGAMLYAWGTGDVQESLAGTSWASTTPAGAGTIADCCARGTYSLVMLRANNVYAYMLSAGAWNWEDLGVLEWNIGEGHHRWDRRSAAGLCCAWNAVEDKVYIGTDEDAGANVSCLFSWDGTSLQAEKKDIADDIESVFTYARNDEEYTIYTQNGGEDFIACSQGHSESDLTFLCEGKKNDAGGALLEEVPEVIEDILQDYCGVVDANIDLTQFTTIANYLKGDGTFKVHRYISSVVKTHDLIQQLCRECGLFNGLRYNSVSEEAEYFLEHWKRTLSTTGSYDKLELANALVFESRDYEHYFNQIKAKWQYIPATGKYQEVIESENSRAILEDDLEREWLFECHWRYDASDNLPFSAHVADLLTAFSRHVQIQECGIENANWHELAEIIKATWAYLFAARVRVMKRTLRFMSNEAIYSGLNKETMTELLLDTFRATSSDEVIEPTSEAWETVEKMRVPLHGRIVRMYASIQDAAVKLRIGDVTTSTASRKGSAVTKMIEADISDIAEDTYSDVELLVKIHEQSYSSQPEVHSLLYMMGD